MGIFIEILIVAMYAGAGFIVWRTDDEFSPGMALAFALAIVVTLAVFVAFSDSFGLDNGPTP